MYENCIKRVLDIVLSLLSLCLLSPILIITAILVYFRLGKPILFTQNRIGKNCEIFKIYKFRTMTDKRDENGELLPDEMRLTKFGNFLRTSSLDELPQLLNIIKGDISIIGPRALLVSYLNDYTEVENLRHTVKPGLVGLAALYGRQNQKWKSKFEKDIFYVDNLSFYLDVKIFFGAIKVVLSKKDIYQDVTNREDFFEREKLNERSNNCAA